MTTVGPKGAIARVQMTYWWNGPVLLVEERMSHEGFQHGPGAARTLWFLECSQNKHDWCVRWLDVNHRAQPLQCSDALVKGGLTAVAKLEVPSGHY